MGSQQLDGLILQEGTTMHESAIPIVHIEEVVIVLWYLVGYLISNK